MLNICPLARITKSWNGWAMFSIFLPVSPARLEERDSLYSILFVALLSLLEENVDIAEIRAEELLEALKKGASFKKLAKTHSACPSKKDGGSLGQLTPGQTVAEFERQVFPLPEGLAPHPIETRYGYHVVCIDRKVEGRLLEYSFVKEKISQYLKTRVQRKAISQYIHHLSGAAKIEGIDLEESDSPLLQ